MGNNFLRERKDDSVPAILNIRCDVCGWGTSIAEGVAVEVSSMTGPGRMTGKSEKDSPGPKPPRGPIPQGLGGFGDSPFFFGLRAFFVRLVGGSRSL